MAIQMIVYRLIQLYIYFIFANVIIHWLTALGVRVNPYNPIVQFVFRLTEPLLDRVRQFLPGGMVLDFSPFVVIILYPKTASPGGHSRHLLVLKTIFLN
jgi:YggT family protein